MSVDEGYAQGGLLAFAEAEVKAPQKCALGRFRDTLDEGQRKELDFMVDNRGRYTVSLIHRALTHVGGRMSRSTVDIHLKGGCVCSR